MCFEVSNGAKRVFQKRVVYILECKRRVSGVFVCVDNSMCGELYKIYGVKMAPSVETRNKES